MVMVVVMVIMIVVIVFVMVVPVVIGMSGRHLVGFVGRLLRVVFRSGMWGRLGRQLRRRRFRSSVMGL
jgi:hypothetical protein